MLTELERLLIEQACTRQINRFAYHNDRGEHEALARMFAPDGTFARPSKPNEVLVGREAILAAFTQRPPRKAVHLVSNVVVDIASAISARATSRIVLYAAGLAASIPEAPWLIGHFEDELVLAGGEWLFASRRGGIDFTVR